jgi:hypothetical protein
MQDRETLGNGYSRLFNELSFQHIIPITSNYRKQSHWNETLDWHVCQTYRLPGERLNKYHKSHGLTETDAQVCVLQAALYKGLLTSGWVAKRVVVVPK